MAISAPAPVLNTISLAVHDTPDKLARALWEAGTTDGFFYLSEHGIPAADVDAAFGVSAGFFLTAPDGEKTKGNGDLGYTAVRQETLDSDMPGNGDLKESFYYGDAAWFAAHDQAQDLPPYLSDAQRRAILDKFVQQNTALAGAVLRGLALALGLPRDFLADAHQGEHSRLRLLHYPPVSNSSTPPDELDIRAGAHTDYGSITLLHQHRVSGLQVYKSTSGGSAGGAGGPGGGWVDVPPIPNAIVVNIGDALEFWSGGRLRSTRHRVVMPRTADEAQSRFCKSLHWEKVAAIAFFVHPEDDTLFEPLFSPLSSPSDTPSTTPSGGAGEFEKIISRKGLPAGTRRITSGDYLRMRIAATYGPRQPTAA